MPTTTSLSDKLQEQRGENVRLREMVPAFAAKRRPDVSRELAVLLTLEESEPLGAGYCRWRINAYMGGDNGKPPEVLSTEYKERLAVLKEEVWLGDD